MTNKEQFEQLERNPKVFQPESPSKFNMGNKDKDKNKYQGESAASEGASGDSITSPWNAHHTNRDLSQEREARDAALAKQVVKDIAREMAKGHTHYQALLNERGTAKMPINLKMTSGALGFKVSDPFGWTKDKAIYQRWQIGSEKARHALDAMEGDSEKTKISYFHHWIDGKEMGNIESWRNKKIFISQVLYTLGLVSLKERLLYTLNKLFVKQVNSFLLLLDLDPFIELSSPHNIKYIKFTSP